LIFCRFAFLGKAQVRAERRKNAKVAWHIFDTRRHALFLPSFRD
jgi:hypothetical protein